MNYLQKLTAKLDVLLTYLLVIIAGLLVVDVVWQILTRFILPQPSSFTEEVARFLLIWISLLGGALAYRQGLHLGFDLIVGKLSPKKAVVVQRISCVLVILFAIGVLIIGGANLVRLTWVLGQSSPVLGIPMAFIYSVLPISGALFILYSVEFFLTASATKPEENS